MFSGVLINSLLVAIGGFVGFLLKERLSEKIKEGIFQVIGLSTVGLSISMILKTDNYLIIIFSLIFGSITGEFLKLEDTVNNFGLLIKKIFKTDDIRFIEGFIGSFLVFCIGSMTILGALESALEKKHNIYITKALLDGFISITFSSVYGLSVVLSSILVLIFQSFLVIIAYFFSYIFTDILISRMVSLGGILILAIGFNILNIKKINTVNLLPSFLYIFIFSILFK